MQYTPENITGRLIYHFKGKSVEAARRSKQKGLPETVRKGFISEGAAWLWVAVLLKTVNPNAPALSLHEIRSGIERAMRATDIRAKQLAYESAVETLDMVINWLMRPESPMPALLNEQLEETF